MGVALDPWLGFVLLSSSMLADTDGSDASSSAPISPITSRRPSSSTSDALVLGCSLWFVVVFIDVERRFSIDTNSVDRYLFMYGLSGIMRQPVKI
mmetsp:Transcript_33016/g.76061  ORF Transcript_33016/g.76061 Transcript_33016/m.76061 type:complete len:95 (+) Transcript_33016:625-909(+)